MTHFTLHNRLLDGTTPKRDRMTRSFSSSRSFRRTAEDRGFTLIELLVVVIILGILSAIVVFSIGNARDNAEVKACNANAQQVLKALDSYYANQGVYPATDETSLKTALVPLYLKSLPPVGSTSTTPGYDYYLTVNALSRTINGVATTVMQVTGTGKAAAPGITTSTCVAGG